MIKQGKTTPEESVALSFSDDMASVQLGTNYVIPVTITNVDGVGADIGENKVIYIVYKTALVGFLSCVDKPVGSVINDHSGWSFTLNDNLATCMIMFRMAAYLISIWENKRI